MSDEAIDSIPASRLPDLLRRMPVAGPRLRVEGTLEPEAWFGGYVVENFVLVFEALGLRASHARALAGNGFEACFAPQHEKRAWLAAVDAFFAREAAAGPS